MSSSHIELVCEADINGQKVRTSVPVAREAWSDETVQEYAERAVRLALGKEIVRVLDPPVTVIDTTEES